MHVELAIDNGAGDFSLILRHDAGFTHRMTAATRAFFRQRHIVGFVDAGRHEIEFRYRPVSVYWGLGLTLLGFSMVACFCLRK